MDLYVICSHARTAYSECRSAFEHIYIYMVLCSITFVKFPDDSPLRAETCGDIQCYNICIQGTSLPILLVWCRESVTDNARNEHKFWYLRKIYVLYIQLMCTS